VEKVLRKVRSGEMPPPTVRNRPQPELTAFANFLESASTGRLSKPQSGGRRPRLNRAES
jgi:hypothetical protein